MALTTRHGVGRVTASRRTRASRPSRPLVVAPRAFLQDLIRVFTPSTYQNDKVGSSGIGSNFSGRIKHGDRKPFADNFVKGGDKKTAVKTEAAAAEQQELQEEEEPGYLDGAVRRVINNNFTSDGPEVNTGNSGWSGDIHTRNADGFHTKKF